jgi:hypothetical protein
MSKEKTTPTPDKSEQEVPNFKFGFVILVSEDGGVFVEKDATVFSIPVERASTLLEIRRYTSELLMDLQAQSAAEYVTLRLGAIGKAVDAAEKDTPEA